MIFTTPLREITCHVGSHSVTCQVPPDSDFPDVLTIRPSSQTITAWISVSLIRKVFDIKYEDTGSVNAFIEDKSLMDVTMCRPVRF